MVHKAVKSVLHSLKDHPVAISLLALNCIFLGANAWTTHEIAANSRLRESSFHGLLKECIEDRGRK